jgi:glutamyl-tRNA synthetase
MTDKTNPATICVGRLAPSPTGAQHVGNARTYLLAWLSVRLQGGALRLRIEDIDSPRVKPWAIAETLEDLAWLGLDWDVIESEGDRGRGSLDRALPTGVWLQTERVAIYERYLEKLLRDGRLYPCYCSRKDIETAASAPHRDDQMVRYPGTCRHRPVPASIFPHRAGVGVHAPPGEMTGDRPFAWRFRCRDQPLGFVDLIGGNQVSCPQDELGDFVIAKSTGHVAYQLAVVVDDHESGVTEVVRGDDLIPSTFWQLEIYRALGWGPPKFCHVPLVVGPDGRRLAKRHGDTRLSEIRRRGHGPERLLGELARSCGLTATARPMAARDLLDAVAGLPSAGLETSRSAKMWSKLPRQPYVLTESTWAGILRG